MVALIIGGGELLDTLKRDLPARAWQVPYGSDVQEQARFLAEHPAPDGRGYVFASESANWVPASRAGWTVYWCRRGQVPVGAVELPSVALEGSIRSMMRAFWGVDVADKRLVGDVLLGRKQRIGTVLYVTSGSGGVGKSTSSRRLCERAAQMGVSSLLVDANPLQSSQRNFFGGRGLLDVRTISDWTPGDGRAQHGANQGRQFGVAYDLTFAPETGQSVPWRHYADYIHAARKIWQFVVVDLDRISPLDLDDASTAAGALVTPSVMSGDLVLVPVKLGMQTQRDAMNLLATFPRRGLPDECVGIKEVLPIGMQEHTDYDYAPYGTYLGAERQSVEAERRIERCESNWADANLDLVRENVLAWALPERGFDPKRYLPKERRTGLWHRKQRCAPHRGSLSSTRWTMGCGRAARTSIGLRERGCMRTRIRRRCMSVTRSYR